MKGRRDRTAAGVSAAGRLAGANSVQTGCCLGCMLESDDRNQSVRTYPLHEASTSLGRLEHHTEGAVTAHSVCKVKVLDVKQITANDQTTRHARKHTNCLGRLQPASRPVLSAALCQALRATEHTIIVEAQMSNP
jgi:hypothetical protein